MVRVTGVVIDEATRKPVENATIVIGTGFALSGQDGRFGFDVPAGQYNMQVLQRYYEKLEYPLTVYENLTEMTISLTRE